MDHRQNGWLAAIGIHRCTVKGCGAWPCMPYRRTLVDPRDVAQERRVIERQRQILIAQHGTASRPA